MESKPTKYIVKYWAFFDVKDISTSNKNFVALSDKQWVRSAVYPFLPQLLKLYVNNDLDTYTKLAKELNVNIYSTCLDLKYMPSRDMYIYHLKDAIPCSSEYESSDHDYDSSNEAEGGSLNSTASSGSFDALETAQMFGDLVKNYDDEELISKDAPVSPICAEEWKIPSFYANIEILIHGKACDFLIASVNDPFGYLNNLSNEEYNKRWNKCKSMHTDFKKHPIETYHGGKVLTISFSPMDDNSSTPVWSNTDKQNEQFRAIIDRIIKLDYIHDCELQNKKLQVYKSIATIKENLKLLKAWKGTLEETADEMSDLKYEEAELDSLYG